MSKNKLIIALFCAAMINAVIAGCGSSSSSSSSTDSGPKTYTQTLLDADTIWAVTNGIGQIYNDNLAGHTVGSQNLTASCPLGGTVHITGTTGYSSNNGITTVSLTYDMTGCKITKTSSSGTSVSLTLTGALAHTGSFSTATSYRSENYQSQNLTMSGSAHRTGYIDATVNNVNCSFNGAITQSGTSSTTSGSVCGNTIASW